MLLGLGRTLLKDRSRRGDYKGTPTVFWPDRFEEVILPPFQS